MFFSRRKRNGLTEDSLRAFILGLEQDYGKKNERGLLERFHPDKRQMSFFSHFSLMLTFQIYHIHSEVIDFQLLKLDGDHATFTYTRKHTHTCVNPADEREEKRDNITSFYVEVVLEKATLWIIRYSPYSVVYIDKQGVPLPGVESVLPPGEEINRTLERLLRYFQLDSYLPATFHPYSDSQFIGFYPQEERYRYKTSSQFSIDFFEKMAASSVKEHTEEYVDQEILVSGDILEQTEYASVVETKYRKQDVLEHELVANLLTEDGFYMIRYLEKTGQPMDPQRREKWLAEMRAVMRGECSNRVK